MKYHQKRLDKEITSLEEIFEIIDKECHLTISMVKENIPYLATMNYSFDQKKSEFYFHCSSKGRKLEYLKDNNLVYGQILEDNGPILGKCNHAYRTVQFSGKVSFLEDEKSKLAALELMIDQIENDAQSVKKKMLNKSSVGNVVVGKIKVDTFTAKRSPAL